MRKCAALILSLLIFAGVCPVFAESVAASPVYSAEAAEAFCDAWNQYFAQNDLDASIGYMLSDDGKQMEYFDVMFNNTRADFNFASGLIPSDATLYFVYDIPDESFGLCVFADRLKGELEKAVVYTDDRVFTDLITGTKHNEEQGYDMWSVTVDAGLLLGVMDYDSFTVRLTIDGKSEVFDMSYPEYDYFYSLVDYLVRMELYSDTAYDSYLNPDYLPEQKAETTPEPTEAPAGPENAAASAYYSFREDLDALDKAAKSVFYVEIYDEMFNCLGNASGFVAFDEHLFVTNQHVIDGAAYMKIWDENDRRYLLDTVVMSDKLHDIAILAFDEGVNYAALDFGLDAELMRGQPVVTIGSPNGFQGTVAFGNISAFPVIPQYGNEKCIQYTAPTSHGSSGGVLFDDRGKVIGITSAVYAEGQNLNFAIPIRLVKDLYDRWDGKSTVALGSERSWDTEGVTPTPAATPRPTPVPAGVIVEGTAETLPAGEDVNLYGEITCLTYFRSGPSSYSALKKGALKAGEVVLIVSNEINERNEIWSKVIANETEGYVRSRDIRPLGGEETAPPVPDVTAIPTAELTQAPAAPAGSGSVVHVDLTADNFLDYFNAESESELNDKKAIFKYKITPSDRVGEITEDSSNVIFVTVCFSVYSDANDGSPVIGKTESTIMLKRDEGYRYSGEAKLKLDEYLESVFWDGEITYVYGHLN